MLLELLAVGTWLFWVLVAVFSIMAMVYSERDEKAPLVIATLIMLGVFGKELFNGLAIKTLAVYAIAYICIGMAWSVAKWWLHVRRVNNEIAKAKQDGTLGNRSGSYISSYRDRLEPTNNKGRLTSWVAYWPWSMIWSVIHDAVDAAYEMLLKTYRSISSGGLKELADFEADHKDK